MSPGRQILTMLAALTAVGGFLADWNRTHLFNPNWPPHTKYHDAQSIVLGSLLGASVACREQVGGRRDPFPRRSFPAVGS
jgi:hypothetical protein